MSGDVQVWRCHTTVRRFFIPRGVSRGTRLELTALARLGLRDPGLPVGQQQRFILEELGVEPVVTEVDGNLLMYGGASVQWQTLIGNGTTTAGQNLTYFNNAQARLAVGDSTTATAATQTDLQATTNKVRVGMDATYPQHTDSAASSAAANITYQSTFSTAQGNYAWQEWGLFNASTGGRMLNRKVESLGTKTSAAPWTLTITLGLS